MFFAAGADRAMGDDVAYGLYLAGMAAALLIAAVNYREIKEYTFYMRYHYVRTGQAQDYKGWMDEVGEILLNTREKRCDPAGDFRRRVAFDEYAYHDGP